MRDPVPTVFARLLPIAAALFLGACAAAPVPPATPPVVPGYGGIQDGAFFIRPVEPELLPEYRRRAVVPYNGPEEPGTIVVDTYARKLYLVMEGGQAMRYATAVGRLGLAFKGDATIRRKVEWPSWTPTANMIRTRPDLYAAYSAGLPGGLSNPLGARALYLYRNGRDTYFRIHGTSEYDSIGRATSAGCIRLFNQDIIDLYGRVPLGTRVKSRTEAESLALEGPQMEDAAGYIIPYDPAHAAQMAADRLAGAGTAEVAPSLPFHAVAADPAL